MGPELTGDFGIVEFVKVSERYYTGGVNSCCLSTYITNKKTNKQYNWDFLTDLASLGCGGSRIYKYNIIHPQVSIRDLVIHDEVTLKVRKSTGNFSPLTLTHTQPHTTHSHTHSHSHTRKCRVNECTWDLCWPQSGHSGRFEGRLPRQTSFSNKMCVKWVSEWRPPLQSADSKIRILQMSPKL